MVSFVYDPLAHAVCCVEPVVAKWPGEAAVHSPAALRSVALENDRTGVKKETHESRATKRRDVEAAASQKRPDARRAATARDELPTMRLSEIN